MAGKSKVELDHLEAALGMFGNARSGQRLRSKQFVGGNSWVVDILIDVDGLPLIIEYDGVYWHTGTARPKGMCGSHLICCRQVSCWSG